MRLFTVVPEHVVLVTLAAFLALIFRSIPLFLLAILYIAFLLYYTRGPDKLMPSQKYTWTAPCHGTVIRTQCTQVQSEITWEHRETLPHGLYAPIAGTVQTVERKKKNVTLTLSHAQTGGDIVLQIHSLWLPTRVVVRPGQTISQGTLLAFMPSQSHITLKSNMYDQEWYIQKDDVTMAGQIIGHVKQLWNL